MEYDKLVDTIVHEVLTKINTDIFQGTNEKIAVIFDKDDLQKYSNIMSPEYKVVLYEDNIRDCSVVIITKLCLKTMANLANLISSTKEEEFIIKMLMKGKKIYVADEGLIYKKYKNSAPKQVYNKFLEFEGVLKNYGIEIMNSYLNKTNTTTIEKEETVVINKNLITEADVRKQYLMGNKAICINSKSIITPLAKDYIKINNIEILK